MADVVDRDFGWASITQRVMEADGTEVRVGVLSGAPRYPDRGKTPVARVAAVHGLHRLLGAVYDTHETEITARINAIVDVANTGGDFMTLMLKMAEWLRDLYRHETQGAGLYERGYLLDTIRGAVFAGRRVAGDRPAARPEPR